MTDAVRLGWAEIRCPSAACTDPRGRVLWSQKDGAICTVKRGGQGLILVGFPVLAFCRCGYVWRSADHPDLLSQIEAMCLEECVAGVLSGAPPPEA